jgi:transcription antitermination factor NusG
MISNLYHWYALRVQTRRANAAAAALRGKGFEEFLPVYSCRRRWSDREKIVELPLFPGYIFCRIDLSDRLVPVLTTPGVTGFVSAGRVPFPVAEQEIETLQRVARSGLSAVPCPYVRVGSRITLEAGPLAGLEGLVMKIDSLDRLVVSISLLQRSVAIEIDPQWARALEPLVANRLAHAAAACAAHN